MALSFVIPEAVVTGSGTGTGNGTGLSLSNATGEMVDVVPSYQLGLWKAGGGGKAFVSKKRFQRSRGCQNAD